MNSNPFLLTDQICIDMNVHICQLGNLIPINKEIVFNQNFIGDVKCIVSSNLFHKESQVYFLSESQPLVSYTHLCTTAITFSFSFDPIVHSRDCCMMTNMLMTISLMSKSIQTLNFRRQTYIYRSIEM
jgi:hypothetical protein